MKMERLFKSWAKRMQAENTDEFGKWVKAYVNFRKQRNRRRKIAV